MREIKICKKRLLFAALFIIAFIPSSFAQLKADFSIDKNGGCSPLTVSFSSTTTGASSNAVYSWDFGNGNTSTLMNAGATYVDAQTYTIKLTVTDAGNSSSQTKQITVYKRPIVDFSFDAKKGCFPLPVNFTSSATPGDGSIANYYWDFGDGSTQQSYSQQTQHTYNFADSSMVGLTVTNSYGCYTSIQKPATIVLPAMQASFSADKTVLCNISDPAKFSNMSTGSGSLSYAWDFGDGNNSTQTSPSHIYNKKGTYSVKLTVSNNDGCSSTSSQINYMNVRDFASDFDVPSPICVQGQTTFTDKSNPVATSKVWLVDNTLQCYWCYANFGYTFNDTLKHTIQLVNTYGTCLDTATKQVSAKLLPDIKQFIINEPPNCGAPVIVNFKDTTKDVASWLWNFDWSVTQPSSTIQSPSYTYTGPWGHTVELTVTNAAGCSASEFQNVYTGPVNVSINTINTDYLQACDSVHATFKAYATDSVTSYLWDFGDGTTSTDSLPQHTFTKEGDFNVNLTWVTKNGCTGTTKGTPDYIRIHVSKHHVFDFTASGITICGNTPVTFSLNSGSSYNRWDFGDGSGDQGEFNNTVIHQYARDSLYTISVILSDYYGLCPDTITKKDYIKVLPPFPKILSALNTCDGMRNVVTFKDTSYKALTWDWDFGDATPHFTSNASQTITHTYAKTGAYKVVLTNTNGQCSVRDSAIVYVLLKQQPILSANITSACTNAMSIISITNMETNPAPDPYFGYGNYYNLFAMQYGDSTSFAYNGYPFQNSVWQNSTNWTITDLDPTKKDLRIISTSSYFGCNDTSNYIPFKINGPKAGFKLSESSPCFDYPVIIQDTSIADNSSPIVSWQWDFGDGTNKSEVKAGTEYHTYTAPGQYFVQLKVTDANGCSDNSTNYYTDNGSHYANPSGPKSIFSYSPANVTPNSPITFSNYTNTFQSGNTQYLWIFGDGSSSTDFSPTHVYKTTAIDTVKLIAINPDTHCRDTSMQIINVKIINTQFSFNKTYVSASTCPPVIVHFTNTSSNALSVAWDFGDGSKADNQNNPSHTYYNAGTYKITMYGYGYNGTTDTTVDSIIVKAPFAKLNADAYFGCLSKTITLSAQIQNASAFVWDFGDGTVAQTKDSFSMHSYFSPGIYLPALIMTDSSGCSLLSYLDQKVVIDSLGIKINETPAKLCGPGTVTFSDPVIFSFAEQQQVLLQYHWDFGTGNVADTSNISSPSFMYNRYGKSFMNITVRSPYGCVKTATDSILVVPKASASIAGPQELCANGSAQFTGLSTLTDSIIWLWDFGNGNGSSLQNPPKQIFIDAKDYKISLIINHIGCYDTAIDNLAVHPNPIVNVDPKKSILCLGNSVQLNAHDGINYLWSPANGLNDNKSPSPIASPTDDITYAVLATNIFNCSSIDSASIKVAKPFTIKAPPDTFVCKGSSVMLPVSGANSYNWISGDGLSSTTISDPIAAPASSSAFTVVGYDAYNCFTDTETVHINVEPLPTVNAGPDINALNATSVQLNATGSSDITQWTWAPPDNLSCVDCPAPISTAKKTTEYMVTVKNQYECIASDTVIVKLTCTQDHVYIPSAFTPDGNGNNDVFYIKGRGVSIIKSFSIYGRWGEVIYERKNINIDDRSSGWDGNYKGQPAPTGTYVYMAELVCDTGELFVMKGTVTLLR